MDGWHGGWLLLLKPFGGSAKCDFGGCCETAAASRRISASLTLLFRGESSRNDAARDKAHTVLPQHYYLTHTGQNETETLGMRLEEEMDEISRTFCELGFRKYMKEGLDIATCLL